MSFYILQKKAEVGYISKTYYDTGMSLYDPLLRGRQCAPTTEVRAYATLVLREKYDFRVASKGTESIQYFTKICPVFVEQIMWTDGRTDTVSPMWVHVLNIV